MKIGVIGNCQARSVVRSIEAMAPDATVEIVHAAQVISWADQRKLQVAERMASCDFVLAQVPEQPTAGPLALKALEQRVPVIPFPYIAFLGFHPDCTYVSMPLGRLKGPLGEYQSAICCASFAHGLSPARAISLYNMYVYTVLEFRKQFDYSARSLTRNATQLGYDISRFLDGNIVFMHTVNHPTADILHDLARQALRIAGAQSKDAPVPEDELAKSVIWPLYPGVARTSPCRQDLRFRALDGAWLDLNEFVEASYAAMNERAGQLQSPAVDRVGEFFRSELV